MPILVQDIVNRVASMIDAEGSEYYLFQQDYLPAIIQAQDFVCSVINSELGNKKFSEEIFRDLTYAQVWQASQFSRITIDPPMVGGVNQIWTILDVIPLPTTYPAFTPVTLTNPNYSTIRLDLSHLESEFYATRLSVEEWEWNKRNPFAQGHTPEPNEQASSYAYLMQTNYTSTNYQPQAVGMQPQEIEIRPSVAAQPVTIKYVKVPTQPAAITDNIEFPQFVKEIIVASTAHFMSYKQADQSTLQTLSTQLTGILLSAST